uniref:M56 family metallopeptidase n=1 Tax=Longirhabdus pacifica TaxID=2305227 RepID=UPI0013E8C5EC
FLLKRYAAKWTYYAWLIIIIGLIIPFRPEINMSLIEVNLPFVSTENEAQMAAPGDDSFQSIRQEQPLPYDQSNGINPHTSYDSSEIGEELVTDSNVHLPMEVHTEGTHAEFSNIHGEVISTSATVYPEEQGKVLTSDVGWSSMIFAIWLAGVIAYLVYQLQYYYRFIQTLYRWSEDIHQSAITSVFETLKNSMNIKTNVLLKQSSIIDTPMLIGLMKPTIVLPHSNYDSHELRFVLTHELVHYKRKDVWVKALTMVATAMHWFNPLLYVMSKAISTQCEISCDEAVVKRIDQNGRREYG